MPPDMRSAVALSCLIPFFVCPTESLPQRPPTELSARQGGGPLDAALTGLFSPPIIVVMGMSALLYTFEKFAKDMMKAASERGKLRLRKKKKPTAAPPQTATFKREHRRILRSLMQGRDFLDSLHKDRVW